MIHIKRFILIVQFLTTIPVPVKIDCKEEDFGRGLVFAPVAGLLIGGIIALIYHLLKGFFSLQILSVIVPVIYVVLTGGLHLDGLADTFDGIFSNRSREKKLEIMKDSRIGTNGVLVIVIVLLLYAVFYYSIGTIGIGLEMTILLFPLSGRIGSLVSSGISTYVRTQGLGKNFIDFCGKKEIFIGSIVPLGVFYLVWGYAGLTIGWGLFISAFLITRYFTSKIGGATGDILGAVCELNQVMFLVLTYLLAGFIK